MSASINHLSPFSPIISLQPQHYHDLTHSFAQRQPAIPSTLINFRTLSVTTGVVVPLSSLLRALACGQASSASAAIPFCFINLPPLCAFQKSQALWNQAKCGLFCQTPGWGGGAVMVSRALGTRSGSARILLARWWPAVPFPRASAKVSQGGLCGGPDEENGVSLAGLKPGRPRQESSRRNRRAGKLGRIGRARFFRIRNRAGRLSGPALVSELRPRSRNRIGSTGPVAGRARNRSANGQQETNRQGPAPHRHRHLALRQRNRRHARAASPAPAHAPPPLRTGAASRSRTQRAASGFAPQHFGTARAHAR